MKTFCIGQDIANRKMENFKLKMTNIKENQVKFEAAKQRYGSKFKILTENDIVNLDLKTIYNMYINKEIIFYIKYEQKFLYYYKKHTRRED